MHLDRGLKQKKTCHKGKEKTQLCRGKQASGEKRTNLLYGADGNTCSTGDDEMTVLYVWSNLIQNKGDDVGLHSQEEHITL